MIAIGAIFAATIAASAPASASIHARHGMAETAQRFVHRGKAARRVGSHFARGVRTARTRLALRRGTAIMRRAHRGRLATIGRFAATRSTIATRFVETGRASFYSGGGRTAAGGRVGNATCAHRTLPFGTRVLVTNLANAHQAVLTVNDRGPFAPGRIVDVSAGAAGVLGMLHAGTAFVRVQVLGGPG